MAERIGPEFFLHRYRVTKIYEMGAHNPSRALSEADSYTLKDTTVEKIQDRDVPYQEYLKRMEAQGK